MLYEAISSLAKTSAAEKLNEVIRNSKLILKQLQLKEIDAKLKKKRTRKERFPKNTSHFTIKLEQIEPREESKPPQVDQKLTCHSCGRPFYGMEHFDYHMMTHSQYYIDFNKIGMRA